MGYEEKRGIKEKCNVFGNWIDALLLIEMRLTPGELECKGNSEVLF